MALGEALTMREAKGAGGLGELEIGRAAPDLSPVQLRAVHVRASRHGDHVYTEVEHVFFNPNDGQLEGTFRFPLPDGALVLGLAMEIDGRMMEGEIVARDKAQRVYQSIVDSMRDPAILEWEQGHQFKLRVFPIEPNADKRVVVRYLAPLAREGNDQAFVFATAAPALAGALDHFTLQFDARRWLDERAFATGREIVLRLPQVPNAPQLEEREDGRYLALRVEAVIDDRLAQPRDDVRRSLVVLVDTSRSALETFDLTRALLRWNLQTLDDDDQFIVIASDLAAHPLSGGFLSADRENVEATLTALAARGCDGASDLEAGLREAGRWARQAGAGVQVLYVGDGVPTWGRRSKADLLATARDALGDAPLFAAVLGRNTDAAAMVELTGQLRGESKRLRTERSARAFARQLAARPLQPRATNVRVRVLGDSEAQVFPQRPTTLFAGDTLAVSLRVDAQAPLPRALLLEGSLAGAPWSQRVSLGAPRPTPHVSQRWAARKLSRLTQDDANKAEVVKLSTDHGVLSKHTALLVLESEQAYRAHQIERKRGPASAAAPRVSGADLESVDGARAQLSPNRIQPGDPEIHVPAPASARSVVVVFPFGVTKLAEYEPELGMWTARFLIDDETPDGRYRVRVRITHENGEVELLTLHYDVDTRAPRARLRIRRHPRRPGVYMLIARQRVTEAELHASTEVFPGRDDDPGVAHRRALFTQDLRRVDLRMPDGEMIRLRPAPAGVFRGRWQPERAPEGPVTVRLVTADNASNTREQSVTVEVQ